MKKLLLLRHAKTEPLDPGGSDFDRVLTERGASDATRVGEYIQANAIKIDIVLSSSARRAVQTTELVTQAAGLKLSVQHDRQVYEGRAHELLVLLKGLDSRTDSVLVVGHNPAMEDLLRLLIGTVESMSAGTLAVLRLDGDEWTALAAGTCTLESIVRPCGTRFWVSRVCHSRGGHGGPPLLQDLYQR